MAMMAREAVEIMRDITAMVSFIPGSSHDRSS
jgi:hypothetical protein